MLDIACLHALADKLERSVTDKEIEEVLRLCEENDALIRTIELSGDEKNDLYIKRFITLHQQAIDLVQAVHATMQEQLFQSTKTRKGVSQYEGVKHAK